MNRILPVLVLFAACGGDSGSASPAVDGGSVDAASDLACPRTAAAADRDRFVVVSRPFAAGGGQSPRYEVLALDAAGTLSETGTTFEMSRAFSGTIAFTADGAIGVTAHDDGSVGVFAIDSAGAVTVIDSGTKYEFYASEVRASADGRRIYVIDGEFRNIGGGIYSLAVTCDGTLIDEGLIAPAQLPSDIAYLADGRAIIPADDILESPAGSELHLVDLSGDAPAWIAGTDLFGETDAIVSEVAIAASGSLVVVGDSCGFCGPNRLAVAKHSGDSLVFAQTIAPFNDPYDLVPSPFDDRVLVVSGFGNAFFDLAPATTGADPYAAPVELTYSGAAPQLPGNAVMIERGALAGMLLIPEVEGVRRVQFVRGAPPTDLGLFTTSESNAGAIGVQP